MSSATIISSLLAVGITVSAIRWIYMDGGRSKLKRVLMTLGAMAAGCVVELLFVLVFNRFPALRDRQIDVALLRMVIFALTLIVLMLLRPQGVFADKEFSWDWVARIASRLFSRRRVAR